MDVINELEKRLTSGDTISEEEYATQINTLFSSNAGSLALRSYISRLVTILQQPSCPNNIRTDFIPLLLAKLENGQLSLEEHAIELRLILATAQENTDDHLAAAKTLSGIPLNSTQKIMTDSEKGRIIIRTVRDYLEVDDPTSAEIHLNKFKNIMHEVHDNESLIHFQLSQARINDSRRDFLAASAGYYDLSTVEGIDPEEQMVTLGQAVKCAVLAPAGPARSRILKRLYDDERALNLESYRILKNMHLQRLIAPADVKAFAESLAEHQLAKLSDGSTVLQRAMFEHNLLAVSKVYASIHTERLGELLGMDGEKAEDMVAGMIQQGRMGGSIDGIEGWITFESSEDQSTGGGSKLLKQWDSNVEGLTRDVESVFAAIQSKHPEFVERNLVIEQ